MVDKNKTLSEAMKGNSNGKNGGRQTKYKPEFADQMLEFFSLDKASYKKVKSNQGAIQMVARRMPTLQRFAHDIGVDVSTLRNWSTARDKDSDELLHPEFSHAYSCAKDCQMGYILEAGVVGALNPAFVNLFMKNAHGWSDKTVQEVNHSSSVDLSEVDADLKIAADERARKSAEMKEQGKTGRFDT